MFDCALPGSQIIRQGGQRWNAYKSAQVVLVTVIFGVADIAIIH